MNRTLVEHAWTLPAQLARCWLSGWSQCEPPCLSALEGETAALQKRVEYALRGARFPVQQRIVLAGVAALACVLLFLLALCASGRRRNAADSKSRSRAAIGSPDDDDAAAESLREKVAIETAALIAAHQSEMAALQDRLDSAEAEAAQLVHRHARQLEETRAQLVAPVQLQLDEVRAELQRAQAEQAQTLERLGESTEAQRLRAAPASSPRGADAAAAPAPLPSPKAQQQHAAELAALTSKCEERERAVQSLTTQLRVMETKLAAQERAHATEAHTAIATLEARHRSALDSSRAEVASLRAQLDTASLSSHAGQREQVAAAQAMHLQLEAVQAELNALKAQPASHSDPAALVRQQQYAHQLENEVRELRANIAQQHKRIHSEARAEENQREHRAAVQALESESRALQQALGALEVASAAKDESIDHLVAQVADLEHRLAHAESTRPHSASLLPESAESLDALLARVRSATGTGELDGQGFAAAVVAIQQLHAQNQTLQERLRESKILPATSASTSAAAASPSARSSVSSDGSQRGGDTSAGWSGRAPRVSVTAADGAPAAPVPGVQIRINERSDRSNALLTAQEEEDELHRVFNRRRLSAMQAPPQQQQAVQAAAAAVAKMQQQTHEEQLRHVHDLVAKFEKLQPSRASLSKGTEATTVANATAATGAGALTPQQQLSQQLDRLSSLYSSVERNVQHVSAENTRLKLSLAGIGPEATGSAGAAALHLHSPSHSWGSGGGGGSPDNEVVLLDDDEKARLRALAEAAAVQAEAATAQADSAHAEVETLRRQLSEARTLLREEAAGAAAAGGARKLPKPLLTVGYKASASPAAAAAPSSPAVDEEECLRKLRELGGVEEDDAEGEDRWISDSGLADPIDPARARRSALPL